MFLEIKKLLTLCIFIGIAVYFQYRWKKVEIPEHLVGHPAKFIPEFIEEKTQKELLKLIKKMKVFPSFARDMFYFNRTFEDAGESIPISLDGTCADSYLIPNQDKTKCLLHDSFDVGRHYVMYGGIEGMKESFELLASRAQSFGQYMFDLNDYPIVKELFDSERFVKAVKEICPLDKPFIDPFKSAFILQVPGQILPIHLDTPYFLDATRFQYPEWLLSVMLGSGLYQDKFIDQIQGIGYLHEWIKPQSYGLFAYFEKNDLNPVYERPLPRAVMLLDGSKMVHSTTLYEPNETPPILPKDSLNELVFSPTEGGAETWTVKSDGRVLRRYNTSDLRISIVYRAKCFENEQKRDEFNAWFKSGTNIRPIEDILEELKTELVQKRGYTTQYLDALKRLDLILLLIDEFVKYPPPPNAIFPFNYCLFSVQYPWMKGFLKYFCD